MGGRHQCCSAACPASSARACCLPGFAVPARRALSFYRALRETLARLVVDWELLNRARPPLGRRGRHQERQFPLFRHARRTARRTRHIAGLGRALPPGAAASGSRRCLVLEGRQPGLEHSSRTSSTKPGCRDADLPDDLFPAADELPRDHRRAGAGRRSALQPHPRRFGRSGCGCARSARWSTAC